MEKVDDCVKNLPVLPLTWERKKVKHKRVRKKKESKRFLRYFFFEPLKDVLNEKVVTFFYQDHSKKKKNGN